MTRECGETPGGVLEGTFLEEVSEDDVYVACARLRFAEALRRRWREARGEAAVQEAVNLSLLEGVRITAAQMRELASSSPAELDPKEALAVGLWRAAWDLQESLPKLNIATPERAEVAPLPAVLARINRDVCSYLVTEGHMDGSRVAIPVNPGDVLKLVEVTRSSSPALHKVGVAWQLIAGRGMFEMGSVPTAFLFGKWLLARHGVEPTAVSVLSKWAAVNRQEFLDLVHRTRGTSGAAGEGDALTPEWTRVVRVCAVEGCSAGEALSRAIQAGRYPD